MAIIKMVNDNKWFAVHSNRSNVDMNSGERVLSPSRRVLKELDFAIHRSPRLRTRVVRKPPVTFQQPTRNAGGEPGVTAEASSP